MNGHARTHRAVPARGIGFFALLLAATLPVASAQTSFLGPLNPGPSVSTVPANGDVNPYGVTQVPVTTGNLVQGDILVSNFNNSANLQGTDTTIKEISPAGAVQTFTKLVDTGGGPPPGAGDLFGIVAVPDKVYFVDDGTNTLNVLQ